MTKNSRQGYRPEENGGDKKKPATRCYRILIQVFRRGVDCRAG
jgi:hypothetical protein